MIPAATAYARMASAMNPKEQAELGYELGATQGLAGVKKAANLAQGAFTLLFTLIILAVAALVGGEFIGAIPTNGPFGSTVSDLENNAQTGFTLFAVGLLIIPAAALIGYLYTNLGGMMGRMAGR